MGGITMEKILEVISNATGNFFSRYILPVCVAMTIFILSDTLESIKFTSGPTGVADVVRIGIIIIMISITIPDLTFFIQKKKGEKLKSFSMAGFGFIFSIFTIYLLWDKAFVGEHITLYQAFLVELSPRLGIAIRKFFLIVNGKKIANEIDSAYMDGYEDGYQDGIRDGKQEGFALGKRSNRRQLLPPGDN